MTRMDQQAEKPSSKQAFQMMLIRLMSLKANLSAEFEEILSGFDFRLQDLEGSILRAKLFNTLDSGFSKELNLIACEDPLSLIAEEGREDEKPQKVNIEALEALEKECSRNFETANNDPQNGLEANSEVEFPISNSFTRQLRATKRQLEETMIVLDETYDQTRSQYQRCTAKRLKERGSGYGYGDTSEDSSCDEYEQEKIPFWGPCEGNQINTISVYICTYFQSGQGGGICGFSSSFHNITAEHVLQEHLRLEPDFSRLQWTAADAQLPGYREDISLKETEKYIVERKLDSSSIIR